MLFANRTEDDILMKETLDVYAKKHNVKVFYSVDKSITTNWTGFTGYISEDKVTQSIPNEVKDTLFMSCGPPPLCNGTEKIWKSLNVPTNQIFRFWSESYLYFNNQYSNCKTPMIDPLCQRCEQKINDKKSNTPTP